MAKEDLDEFELDFNNKNIISILLLIGLWFLNFYIADEVRKKFNECRAQTCRDNKRFARYASIMWIFLIPVVLVTSIIRDDSRLAYGTVAFYLFGLLIFTDNPIINRFLLVIDV
jgi:hypothetical protein